MSRIIRSSKLFFLIICTLPFFGLVSVNAQDDDGENCAVPITRLNGEVLPASGVAGGLTTIDPQNLPEGTVNPVTGEELLPADVHNAFESFAASEVDLGSLVEDTAILVVDSFGDQPGSGGQYTIPEEVFTLPEGTITGSAPEPDDAQLMSFYDDGTLTHGAMVFNHINALLYGALSQYNYSPGVDLFGSSIVWSSNDADRPRIFVRMVNALSYEPDSFSTTAVIGEEVQQAITELNRQDVTSFVMNMSFAVLPCSRTAEYEGYNSFTAYLEAVVAGMQEGALTDLYRSLIVDPVVAVEFDPLLSLILNCGRDVDGFQGFEFEIDDDIRTRYSEAGNDACDPDDPNITFVGSAGNSRLPFPFIPAAWPIVVSVSAYDGLPAPPGYSNYNTDVNLLGGWHRLTDGGGVNMIDFSVVGVPYASVFYRGTSFSAPVESVCLALQIC